MSKRRDLTVWVAVFFFLLWALLTHSHVNSWNDASRLAAVEALVHRGTWAIDNTVFGERTGDRIFWNGHFYPDKPPVLSFLAAGVYAVLHKVLHVSFDFAGWCDPVSSPCYCFALLCRQSPDWAYYLLTLTLTGFPSALMLALFYRSTMLLDLPNPAALLATGALGLGTLVFPHSLTFNNHLLTAASLLLGFYALLRARTGDSPARWLALAGVATALAFTFDLLVAPFLALFLGVAVLRHRLRAWPFLLGSLIPLALLTTLDWWIMGDPLPPSMHPAGFNYPGSVFPPTLTGNTLPADVLDHGLQMLFGDQGLFSLTPVMLWPVFGLWPLFRERHHRLWGELVAAALGIIVTLSCLILFTPGSGGVAYGTRWLLDFTPLLFFFAAWPTLYRPWPRRLLFAVLVVISVFSAWQGALNPWGWSPTPLGFVEYVTSPIGHYLERLPDDTVTYTTIDTPHYLPVCPMHVWHTSLRKFEPAVGALPAGIPGRPAIYVLNADDWATADWLTTIFPQGQWDLSTREIVVYRVPADVERVRPAQPLRAEFGGRIRLLGCDLSPTSLRSGDTVTMQLYWQATTKMYRPYTAFVHLLGPTNPATNGPLWAQDDHQPGHIVYMTERWLPGEIVLDRFQFTVPDDTPPGEYTVTTGFYDPVTLQRLDRSDAQGDTATLYQITVSSQ
jgi:hypothetical protein